MSFTVDVEDLCEITGTGTSNNFVTSTPDKRIGNLYTLAVPLRHPFTFVLILITFKIYKSCPRRALGSLPLEEWVG